MPASLRFGSAILLMLALVSGWMGARAASADVAAVQLDRAQSQILAREMLAAGNPEVALALARALVAGDPDDAEALVLLASALQQRGQDEEAHEVAQSAYAAAESDRHKFEAAMLVGRAEFRRDAHFRAQVWLRRAAQAAPDADSRAIARRNFRYVQRINPLLLRFSLGVAPSSNINDGSSAEVVEIHGLPFRLREHSRALSGTEFALDFGARYRVARSAHSKTELTFGLRSRAYQLSEAAKRRAPDARGSDYSYSSIEVGAAHSFAPRWDVATYEVEGALGRTWFGGAPLSDYARLSLSRRTPLSRAMSLRWTLTAQHQERHDSAARSATTVGLEGEIGSGLSNGDKISVAGSISRTAADAFHIRNTSLLGRLTYEIAEPIAGVRISSGVDLERRSFPTGFLQPEGRTDIRGVLRLSGTLDGFEYMGFSPAIDLRLSRTKSTLVVHERQSADVLLSIRSTF